MSDRQRMPRSRRGQTTSFRIGGEVKGYLTTGEREDGSLGEIFLKVAKQGSTLSGIMDGFSILFSLLLQYGVPLEVILTHLKGMYFSPMGHTNDPEITEAKSILDYVAQRLEMDYLGLPELEATD